MKPISVTFKLDEISTVVSTHIMPLLEKDAILALSGPLGAGKTTLVREILRQLGVSSPVTSPTFTYVKKYDLDSGKSVYHFDLYRLSSVDAFCEMGFDENLCEEKSFSFVEWPEVIGDMLDGWGGSKGVFKVVLQYVEGDLESRKMQIFL